MSNNNPIEEKSLPQKVWRTIIGAPKDINDPGIFHKLALIPFFAWIGLGADGLSSSSYGPEEAFRALTSHTYLAVFLGLATALTVVIISVAYSKIIEHFPHGGGGYIVASSLLGEKAGVISGSALIVDYILTITVSIVSCVDAIFSYLPLSYQQYKVMSAAFLIVVIIVLNIRGVKESITVLAPIFVVFLVAHIIMLSYGIFSHAYEAGPVMKSVSTGFTKDVSSIGLWAILFIFVRAYSLGGGTYTGIEAVSNGLQIMRDPKVKNGKRTMLYMASSLALAAGGLFFCYLLVHVRITEGKTLNAVLADSLYGSWKFGSVLAFITIFSEGCLLLVGAQAGFIDAPRVMANMAVDSWLPRRFAAFSERLTMRNGVIMIGSASLFLLFYTKGSISALIVMYSINVFLTFSMSEFSMARFYFQRRKSIGHWKKNFFIQALGLGLSVTILGITIIEKFGEGGWLTLLITSGLITLCYLIRRHYTSVNKDLKSLEEDLPDLPVKSVVLDTPIDKTDMTAIQLVGGYGGFGIHTFLNIIKAFRGLYKNYIFVSVALIDQGLFKGDEKLDDLKKSVESSLQKYVKLANGFGLHADYRMGVGTDIVETATEICEDLSREYRNSIVFSGKLAFRVEKFYHRLLHNETAHSIQRRLQWKGINNVIMPIRVFTK